MDSKTPMNEALPTFTEHSDSILDIDEDSLAMMVSSQTVLTTTTESDALTVVTSPVESIPTVTTNRDETSDPTTDNSPPQYDEDFGSNTNQSSSLASCSLEPTNASTKDQQLTPHIASLTPDDCPYEDYVRKLQFKISQISNARDSIDIRKTKRKHSRGELSSGDALLTAIGASSPSNTVNTNPISVIDHNKPLSIFVNKTGDSDKKLPPPIEEPQTVTERIEEISKERAKQKDLIHDMVMDKLQSKKQMNAEKRLNRSRNRSSMFSPTVTSPAGNLPSIVAHHQVVHAKPTYVDAAEKVEASKSSPMKSQPVRPTSELYTKNQVNIHTAHSPYRLTKTQSFCSPSTYSSVEVGRDLPAKFIEHVNGGFTTPVAPPRRNRQDEAITQTEKMRQDARARARLKSSQDLGLSPDEKLLLLRKRFHLDECPTAQPMPAVTIPNNKSDDMKVRERKMMASKSVNDIASVALLANFPTKATADTTNHRRPSKGADYKSETNLLDATHKTGLVKRRQPHPSKDPERRKSIIQAVSDFFHKKKELSPSNNTAGSCGNSSPPKESRQTDSMFGRFRLSPRTKSKVCIYIYYLKFDFIVYFVYYTIHKSHPQNSLATKYEWARRWISV